MALKATSSTSREATAMEVTSVEAASVEATSATMETASASPTGDLHYLTGVCC